MTGKIIELKPGQSVKIETMDYSVITIPYSYVQQIILDAQQEVRNSEPITQSSFSSKSEGLKKNSLSK